VASGSFTFDNTYGDYSELAYASGTSGNNMMVTSTTFSSDVVVTTEFIPTNSKRNVGVGARMTASDDAATGNWCNGYTGYQCVLELVSTDDDDVSDYTFEIKLCDDDGTVSDIGVSSSSWTLNMDSEYKLEFELYGSELTCSVYDSDGDLEASYSMTDDTIDVDGLASLGSYYATTYFASFEACDGTPDPTLAPSASPSVEPTTSTPTVAPTSTCYDVSDFASQPSDMFVLAGGFSFDETTGDYSDLTVATSSSGVNLLATSDTFDADVTVKTTFISTSAYRNVGIGGRLVESSDAKSSNWCQGYLGYQCVLELTTTDDDDVSEYVYEIKLCDDDGSVSDIGVSSSSWTLSLDTEYSLELEFSGSDITCSVYDSSGTLESSYSMTDDTFEDTSGLVSLGSVAATTYFANFEACD